MKIPESPPKITHNKIGDALKYLKNDPYDRLIKEAINKYSLVIG